MPAEQHVVVGQPERAREERAFAFGQAIDLAVVARGVAAEEAFVHQLALDGVDGAADARIFGFEEADQRHQQQRGVEFLRAVVLRERPA